MTIAPRAVARATQVRGAPLTARAGLHPASVHLHGATLHAAAGADAGEKFQEEKKKRTPCVADLGPSCCEGCRTPALTTCVPASLALGDPAYTAVCAHHADNMIAR